MSGPGCLCRTPWPDLALAPDGLPMVRIPAGEYPNLGDERYRDTRPLYTAEIHSFWIHAFPVTAQAFAELIRGGLDAGAAPGTSQLRPDQLLARLAKAGRQGLPFATGVSFFEAQTYAQAHSLRLPNESEWEIAMRAFAQTETGGRDALAKLGFASILALQGTALSRHGCIVAVNRVIEWTADEASPSYVKYGLARNCCDWSPPAVIPGMKLSVRGRAPLRSASPVMRQPLGAEQTHWDGVPLAFRCAISESDAMLEG